MRVRKLIEDLPTLDQDAAGKLIVTDLRLPAYDEAAARRAGLTEEKAVSLVNRRIHQQAVPWPQDKREQLEVCKRILLWIMHERYAEEVERTALMA